MFHSIPNKLVAAVGVKEISDLFRTSSKDDCISLTPVLSVGYFNLCYGFSFRSAYLRRRELRVHKLNLFLNNESII